jgi:hypothetical protein
MKKLLLLFTSLIIVVSVYGQTTTFKTDLVLDKVGTVADRFYLRGNGSLIDWMSGSIRLAGTSGTLSLTGANLSLGTNSLLLTGSIGATGARSTKGWFTNLEITNLPTINGVALSTLFVPVTRTVNSRELSSNINITASDVGLSNVVNESKTTMFDNPVFTTGITTPAITLNGTLITSTAGEINMLDGVSLLPAELNYLSNSRANIQQQIDAAVSFTPHNVTLTGLTIIDQLQIGTSDSAIVIEGLTDVGQGLTVTKDGAPITYNFPSENIINISDIPTIPTIYSAAGDTSNYPTPGKVGNIFIDTSAGKVYVSKSALRLGWVLLN